MSISQPDRVTARQAYRLIGARFQTLESTPRACILMRVRGWSCYLREATDRGQYFWCGIGDLRRRADMDNQPDPAWLAQARCSTRRMQALYGVLNPEQARAVPEEQVDRDLFGAYRVKRMRDPQVPVESYRKHLGDDLDAFEAKVQEERELGRELADECEAEERRPAPAVLLVAADLFTGENKRILRQVTRDGEVLR